jgi:tetratricopeptide (TPR) repeat protein
MRLYAVVLLSSLLLAVWGCDQQGEAPITGPAGPSIDLEYKINSLKEILKKEPGNKHALIELGNAYMDMNRCSEAIPMYSKALELEPMNQNLRVDMGTCQRRIGRPDLAVDAYKKAIAQNPRHAYAHMNLGVVLAYDMNRPEEAIKEFETFLQLAPTDRNAPAIMQTLEDLRGQVVVK